MTKAAADQNSGPGCDVYGDDGPDGPDDLTKNRKLGCCLIMSNIMNYSYLMVDSDLNTVVSYISESNAAARSDSGAMAADGQVTAAPFDSDAVAGSGGRYHRRRCICGDFYFLDCPSRAGLHCLPLVLPERVSIVRWLIHASVMKLASWENMFSIDIFHRWRAGRICSLFLHCITPTYDRFGWFHNWHLNWGSKVQQRVSDSRDSESGAGL